jgi:O-antigen ligase
LVAVGLVSVDWLQKYPELPPVLDRLPRLVAAVPHPTLPEAGVQLGVHPNSLGALLAVYIPLAVAVLSWPRGTRGVDDLAPPALVRATAAVTLVVAVPVLLLTQSRGAWLALAASLMLMAALRYRILWAVIGGAALAGGFIVLSAGPGTLVARARAGEMPFAAAVAGRVELWQDGMALVAEAPATGIGLNNFILLHGRRPEYEGRFIYQGAAHVHNTLLQAAVDYGLPGFVAVAALSTAIAWAAWRAHRRVVDTPLDALVIGSTIALLVFALHGLVDTIAIGAKPGFVVWAFAGLLAAIRTRAHRWTRTHGPTADNPPERA